MTYNKEYYVEYAKKNREKINAYQREWGKKNSSKRNLYCNNWKKNHKEIVKVMKHKSYVKNRLKAIATVKKYQEKNKERLVALKKISSKIYREKNKEKINRKVKEWYENNKERVLKKSKEWALKNKERKNYTSNIYVKKRRLNDINFRISCNMGSDIWHALKDKKYSKKWQILVGFSTKQLMVHLEKQFDDKMSWENYGSYWHIDHIKPKSLFKYSSPEDEEFKKCWALENLQPLEKIANIKKGNRYESN